MKKGKSAKLDLQESIKELNKNMIIEIAILIYFLVSIYFKISLFITFPVTIILFAYEEFKINKIKRETGMDKGGETYRIFGIVIALAGFIWLISSPLFIEIVYQLVFPITLIVVGGFLFIISKFCNQIK